MRLRVLTYNIHKGIGGVDRRYDLSRTIETIQHCDPDIVFLQEVDDGVPRSSGHRQVELLSEALGLKHHAYQHNVAVKNGHYGNAILSRFPLTDHSHLDLSLPMLIKRRALFTHSRVTVDGHTRTLLLINLHLGLSGVERRIQVRKLLTCDVLKRTHQQTGIILGGDFNDVWANLGRLLVEPAGFRPTCPHYKTFPAALPMRPLDRIYIRGQLSIDHGFASRTKQAKRASDHLPLVVDLKIEPLHREHD